MAKWNYTIRNDKNAIMYPGTSENDVRMRPGTKKQIFDYQREEQEYLQAATGKGLAVVKHEPEPGAQ